MSATELHYLPALDLAQQLRGRKLSPVEVTRALLDRIERVDRRLNSYATVAPDLALQQAHESERRIQRGRPRGVLDGVPFAVKDVFHTRTMPTECGTSVLKNWLPPHDATAITRLMDQGAILLGKLQMTEGGFGAHHPSLRAPLNPWNADFWVGASSSGPGAATAAGLCYAALATDTGGSIRHPAMMNGLVGLKPTWGRISRNGVFPLAAPLDHVGIMSRTVADAAAILAIVAGPDDDDPTASPLQVPEYLHTLNGDVRGIRVCVDYELNETCSDARITAALRTVVDVLRNLGADIVEMKVPPYDHVLEAWLPIAATEAYVTHRAHFERNPAAYGRQLSSLLELGKSMTPSAVAAARARISVFNRQLAGSFTQSDLLLTPVHGKFPRAMREAPSATDWPSLLAAFRFTAPFNLTGNPALALPCGFTDEGMPTACQLIARPFEEDVLLRTAYAYEQATDWWKQHPRITPQPLRAD